jgi:hypothetical protein
MDVTEIPPVWKATYESVYECRVVRDERDGIPTGYGARLIMRDTRDGHVLLNEPVLLICGAVFGPDVDDVESWMARVEGFFSGSA